MAGKSSLVPGGGFDRSPPPGRFCSLLRCGADRRLVQHLRGLPGDDRTFEEIGVLRAPEPHGVGEGEVAEVVLRDQPVFDQLVGFGQHHAHVGHVEMADVGAEISR